MCCSWERTAIEPGNVHGLAAGGCSSASNFNNYLEQPCSTCTSSSATRRRRLLPRRSLCPHHPHPTLLKPSFHGAGGRTPKPAVLAQGDLTALKLLHYFKAAASCRCGVFGVSRRRSTGLEEGCSCFSDQAGNFRPQVCFHCEEVMCSTMVHTLRGSASL